MSELTNERLTAIAIAECVEDHDASEASCPKRLAAELLLARSQVEDLTRERDAAKSQLANAVAENLAFNVKAAREINAARLQRDFGRDEIQRLNDELVAALRQVEDLTRQVREREGFLDRLDKAVCIAGSMPDTVALVGLLKAARNIVSEFGRAGTKERATDE